MVLHLEQLLSVDAHKSEARRAPVPVLWDPSRRFGDDTLQPTARSPDSLSVHAAHSRKCVIINRTGAEKGDEPSLYSTPACVPPFPSTSGCSSSSSLQSPPHSYSAWSVLEAPRISALLAILGDKNGTDGYLSLKSLEVKGGAIPVLIQCSNWQAR